MTGKLAGKVAIVTGGAGGIGSAIAGGLAAAGAVVCVADLSLEAAAATARAIGQGAFGVALDVGDVASIAPAVEAVAERAGSVDILINNAAVYGLEPWLAITPAEYDRIMAVNVRGFLFVLQAAAARMVRQGSGSIVNIASAAARRGDPLSVVYSASKATVLSLNQSAALALAKHGIRVNAIAPGAVETAMWKELDQKHNALAGEGEREMTRRFVTTVPLGRMAVPADFVAAALFLASDDSAYMTGQMVNIDGGLFFN